MIRAFALIAFLALCGPVIAQPVPDFEITFNGGGFPTIHGSTNLPNGTQVVIVLSKPWEPNGEARLAAGLPACADNCLPPEAPNMTPTIENGQFSAGPFTYKSVNGPQRLPPGEYPLRIYVMHNGMPDSEPDYVNNVVILH